MVRPLSRRRKNPRQEASVTEKGRGEGEGGAKAAGTTETPAAKAYVDKKGKFEISPTPFGYVKRERKQAEKESKTPGPGGQAAAVSPAPQAKPPAAPPAPRTGPAGPAPGEPEKLAEKKAAPKGAGQVSFDFDDADLYAVIRTMADFLKINYIIDPGVSGKVTIHTAGRLKEEDLFPVFYQTLEVNGLTAVKEGNVYRILKLKDALRMPIASSLAREAKDIPPEERIIIQIIPLKFISAPEVTKVITPFISADGSIVSEAGSNTLLVVDKGINILKVLKLVEAFDVSVFERLSYRFYKLENINPEEAVKLLKEVSSLSAGGGKEDVKFIPINRLNSLLIVSSSPDIFGRVDAFIRRLDIPSEGAQPQIHIYSVKNGVATELGDILRSIFGKGEIKKSAGKESVPTNPFAKGYTERKTTTAAAGPATTATPAPAPAPARHRQYQRHRQQRPQWRRVPRLPCEEMSGLPPIQYGMP